MTRQSQRQDDRGRQVCLAIATTTSEGQQRGARKRLQDSPLPAVLPSHTRDPAAGTTTLQHHKHAA
jgi:hypothetical protein